VRASGFPQSAHTLGCDDRSDVTGATTTVERPALAADVPVLGRDRLEFTASAARLPPDATVSEFASAVDALVLGVGDELEVVDAVVDPVAVSVVDAVTSGDWPVVALPRNVVGEPAPSVEGSSEIALGGDVASVESLWP